MEACASSRPFRGNTQYAWVTDTDEYLINPPYGSDDIDQCLDAYESVGSKTSMYGCDDSFSFQNFSFNYLNFYFHFVFYIIIDDTEVCVCVCSVSALSRLRSSIRFYMLTCTILMT